MNAPTEIRPKAVLGDYWAGERTFQAWIRTTGLALMGFRVCGGSLRSLFTPTTGYAKRDCGTALRITSWFGIALVAVGIFVNVFAGWHHLRLVSELDGGRTEHSHPSTEIAAIALFLALIGLAMTISLI